MYRNIIALGLFALTAACAAGGVRLSHQNVNVAYSPGEFAYAGAGRDLRVEVVGNPFAGDAAAFAAAVTDAMRGQHWGQPANFTTTPGENARRDYRVMMLFNPPVSLNAMRLCRDDAATLPTEATGDGIALFGAFCLGDKELTAIKGHVAGAAGPQDPAFRSLVGQVTRALFPPERDRLRDDRRCPPWMKCD